MKIIQLNAENVKRLKAVEITPDGAVQVVAGRNAQGKSSVLDAIWMALDWKNAGKTTPRPVRDGEERAQVRLDLGDLVVTRKWAGEKTTLTVESGDGKMKPTRPQELLDSLLGHLSFDPLAFTQQGGKEQVQTLLGLVNLPFDPVEIDAERQALYDSRRSIGQDLARAKGAVESLCAPAADVPESEVSTSDLLAEYEAAQGEATERERAIAAASHAREVKARADEALVEAQRACDQANNALAYAMSVVTDLPPAPDLETIKARMAGAEAVNAAVRDAVRYRDAQAFHDALLADYEDKTAEITALDKRKADGLSAAKFPIDGLSFGDDGVTYNGVPFCQASSGEQLRVSLALAMAMNPELRVIRITDGSLLDSENMALVADTAKENDFQVWIERVDESGTCGVVIEDGQVAS